MRQVFMVRQGFRAGGAKPAAALCAVIAAGVLLSGCAQSGKSVSSGGVDPKYGVRASPRVVALGQPIPKGGGAYRVGRPYVVAGRTYVPSENRRYRADGIASWYGTDFHGRLTANGEVYDMHGISAAHPTMPMPSYARVTNLKTGRSLIVRVNDRGPYHDNRVIDLSSKAADLLELRRSGTGRVRVEYVGPASLDGSDDRRLLATLSHGRPAPPPSAVRVASARPFVPEPSAPPMMRAEPRRSAPVLTVSDGGARRDMTPPTLRPMPAAAAADAIAAELARPGSGASFAVGRGLY